MRVDAVEKGKNEPVEIFACAPVEAGFSYSKAESLRRPLVGNRTDYMSPYCPPSGLTGQIELIAV
jgi:hypothetical protein